MQVVSKKRKASGEGTAGVKKKKVAGEPKKKKTIARVEEEDDDGDENIGSEEFVDVDGEGWQVFPSRGEKGVGGSKARAEVLVIDD